MIRQSGTEASIKAQIGDLETKKSREGLTAAETTLLDDLRTELRLRIYDRDQDERRSRQLLEQIEEEERKRRELGRGEGGR